MKKIGLTALIALLLCVLAGCPNDDGGKNGGKTPASMTFVDNPDNPAREFTIDENLNFKVNFIQPEGMALAYGLEKGDVISGKITDTGGAAWNSDLTGVAEQMTATNPTFAGAMPGIKVTISLTYTKVEDVITAVNMELKGEDVAAIADMLMGGTYYIKK